MVWLWGNSLSTLTVAIDWSYLYFFTRTFLIQTLSCMCCPPCLWTLCSSFWGLKEESHIWRWSGSMKNIWFNNRIQGEKWSEPFSCVTWQKRSALSLASPLWPNHFTCKLFSLWFFLIQLSTLAVGQPARTRGLFRSNCLSGLIVPGLFLLLEAPVHGSKHHMCVSALFQVGVLTAHRLSGNCLSSHFYSCSVGIRAQCLQKQS